MSIVQSSYRKELFQLCKTHLLTRFPHFVHLKGIAKVDLEAQIGHLVVLVNEVLKFKIHFEIVPLIDFLGSKHSLQYLSPIMP